MGRLKKLSSHTNDLSLEISKERLSDKSVIEKNTKDLSVKSSKLKEVSRSISNSLKRIKRSFSNLKDNRVLKEAKDILVDYCDCCEEPTLDKLGKFREISKKYGLDPNDRFDESAFKEAFRIIRDANKWESVSKRQLKGLFKNIAKITKQTGQMGLGGFMEPHFAFIQLFLKLPLLLSKLTEEISKYNGCSIFVVRKIKQEIQEKIYEKFGMVDVAKLKNKAYVQEIKTILKEFSEEIISLSTELNEIQEKGAKVSARFDALVGVCM